MKIHLLLMLILSEASPHPLRWETPPALRNTPCVEKHPTVLWNTFRHWETSPALRNTPFALRNIPLHWNTPFASRNTFLRCETPHIEKRSPAVRPPAPPPCVEQYYPALRNTPCVEKHSSALRNTPFALRNTTPRWETPLCVEKHSLCVEKYSLALRNILHPALRNAYVSDTIKVFMTLTRHIFVIKFF